MSITHLTTEQITDIRRKYFTSDASFYPERKDHEFYSSAILAREFNCEPGDISRIINFKIRPSDNDLRIAIAIMENCHPQNWGFFFEHGGFIDAAREKGLLKIRRRVVYEREE